MIPFFSPRTNGKEQVAGRAVVSAAALLFLVTALLSALPSKDRLADLLERSGLSGYSRVEETTPSRPAELEEFHDRPLTDEGTNPSADPDPVTFVAPDHTELYYSSGGTNEKIA